MREAINKLPLDKLVQIVKDYEKFELDGFIGDCELRHQAEAFRYSDASIVLLMERIAFEVYRNLANEYIEKEW